MDDVAPAPASTSDLPRAASFMIASALMFAAMGVAVKLASRQLPNVMVVFVRSALGLVLLVPWLLALGVSGLRTRNPGEHLLRGLAGLGSMYCFFFALGRLRLAEAMLLNYSLPLFVPFIEHAWLREPLEPRLLRAILLGFLGLALILKPGLALFEPAALVGVLGAVLAALAQVGVRRLTQSEPVTRIVFYFGLVSSAGSALPAALDWMTPGRALVPLLVGLALSATLAQLLMTRAYSFAPAAQVGPFIYASVVFGGLLDWLWFGKLPDALTLAGTLLVVMAGVWTLRIAAGARAAAGAGA
jgi:drug/metabolite transporter (DMT)-like permease